MKVQQTVEIQQRCQELWEHFLIASICNDLLLGAVSDHLYLENMETLVESVDKKEKLEFIVSKFTANLHAKPYLEDQFMDSIRNLEVYARNFIVQPKNIISNEESENINRVINYINKNVDKEFKNRLRNRLKYKRKDSDLRKKLTYLFENISVELKQQYFSNQEISEVVNRLYDTRNYYTHGEERSNYKNLITDYHEMYDLLQLCQEVLRFYIFKEIGLEYSKEY